MLVYCTKEHREELEQALVAENPSVYVNNCERKVIEHLDDLDALKLNKYPVLLIDDPQYMRGHNYRSKKGIMLILCRGFKTKRDSVQGIGRVGRYNDPCTRYKTVEDLVDKALLRDYLGGLYKHVTL